MENSQYVNDTLALLSSKFGGATASKALGAWVAKSGQLVTEKVDLVFAYATSEQLEEHIDLIHSYCIGLKHSLSQEAIALEVNGELYLV